MSDKRLTNVQARLETDDRNRPTGWVAVYALPAWLKGDRFVAAQLTPKEARRLAIDLLEAAERSEEMGHLVTPVGAS